MSVSDEFRRLLLHAAQLLAEVEPAALTALSEVVRQEDRKATRATPENRYDWNRAMGDYRSFVAAMAHAQLVMEMTAKFLTDELPADTEGAEK